MRKTFKKDVSVFSLVRKTEMPFYNGVGYLYRHEKTGMEVFCLENDSAELAAAFAFATPSEDSTGLAHILEHTVLNGSGRYPVKDPFIRLVNSSPNTFLNAMTFSDKTVYPFASPLKKDFDNIFDIYADAVFNPLLRRESFEQEGVRFFDGKADGVVFNEMCGARSSEDSAVSFYCVNKLLQNTPYKYDSGGEPLNIADLRYEDYLERYKKWYSPANCRLFLFGALKAEEYLEKLEERYLRDEYFSNWSGKRFVNSPSLYFLKYNTDLGIKKPMRDMVYCGTKDAYSVVLTFLTVPSDDPFSVLKMSVLTDLMLEDPGAPLRKAITESDLGRDLHSVSGIDGDYPLVGFTVGFVGAKPGAEDEIEAFLLKKLEEIYEEGFTEAAIEGAIKRLSFKLREIQGDGRPVGVSLAIRLFRYWMKGVDPEIALEQEGLLERLKAEIKKGGFFENLIKKHLLDNPVRCLLTVKEDPEYKITLENKLHEKYSAYVSSMDEKTLEKQKKDYLDFINTEDSKENLSKLPCIKLSDLPDSMYEFDTLPVEKNGVTLHVLKRNTHKICYLNFAFDTTSFSEKEKKLMGLLSNVIYMADTKKHSFVEIGNLIKKYFGALYYLPFSGVNKSGKCASHYAVRAKMLNEDIEPALDLLNEILTLSVVTQKDKIKTALTEEVTGAESVMLDFGNFFVSAEAGGAISPIMKERTFSGLGIGSYFYYKELLNNFDEVSSELASDLEALRIKLFNRAILTTTLVAEEDFLENAADAVSRFVNGLPLRINEKTKSFYESFEENAAEEKKKRLFLVSTGPSYNSLCFSIKDFSGKERNIASLFADVTNGAYVIDMIRGKNAAYGASFCYDSSSKMMIYYSYRDPKIDSTFEVFENALDYEVSEEELEKTLITYLGRGLKPPTPEMSVGIASMRLLTGETDEVASRRRREMSLLKVKDLEAIRGKLKESFKNNSIATMCSDAKESQIFKGMEGTILGV